MLKFLLPFFLLLGPLFSYGQVVYFQEFDSPPASSAMTYSGTPTAIAANLMDMGWTSTTNFTNYNGTSGKSLAISNSGGTPTITLTLNIDTSYVLDISSFDFWVRRSSTGAQNYDLKINGNSVTTGIVPSSGAFQGPITPATPINGLSGQVNIELALSGATGTGTFRLDNFIIEGVVRAFTPAALTHINLNCLNKGYDVHINWSHDQADEVFAISRTDNQNNRNLILSDITEQEGSYIDHDLLPGDYLYQVFQEDDGEIKIAASQWVSVSAEGKLRAYPNPTTSALQVGPLYGDKLINIYNTQGQNVLSIQGNEKLETIDLSEYAPGVYIIEHGTDRILLEKK